MPEFVPPPARFNASLIAPDSHVFSLSLQDLKRPTNNDRAIIQARATTTRDLQDSYGPVDFNAMNSSTSRHTAADKVFLPNQNEKKDAKIEDLE